MIPSPAVDLLPAQLAACVAIGWLLGIAFVLWCEPRQPRDAKFDFTQRQK